MDRILTNQATRDYKDTKLTYEDAKCYLSSQTVWNLPSFQRKLIAALRREFGQQYRFWLYQGELHAQERPWFFQWLRSFCRGNHD